MIERYTRPEMGRIWSEEHKYACWLRVELLACEAMAELGRIPAADLRRIKERARFDAGRIAEIEAEVQHDVIAFLTNVAEYVGEAARFMHQGMTSSDVLDTALALQLQEAVDLILAALDGVLAVLERRAWELKDQLMIGRTHGVHAEPVTMGLKLALWFDEMRRNRERLLRAREAVSVGKVSGAVGTFAHLSMAVEESVCRGAGLQPARISTQIVQRDRHAELLSTLAILGGTIEKIAVEVRHLQRTEVREVAEPFAAGQKGSSAMPHKRNPIKAEQLSGLARLLRANALAALENQALWHERDISHSSVERVILPDSTILAHYMLVTLRRVLDGLVIDAAAMQRNLNATGGLICSQQVLLALTSHGMSRESAYAMVQRHAMEVWAHGGSFWERLAQEAEVAACLSSSELEACFDLKPHVAAVEAIFGRVFGASTPPRAPHGEVDGASERPGSDAAAPPQGEARSGAPR